MQKRRSEHYFSAQPTSPSEPHTFTVTIRDRTFTFRTDAGVFSHRFIDRGTRLLLNSLPLPVSGEALDWGAGYGPIGIVVAALSPQTHVVMAEINERAAALARENATINRVPNVEVVAGDAFETLGHRRFSIILTNPPIHAGKPIVMALIDDSRARLDLGGEFWMVVRTQDGAQSYLRALEAVFDRVTLENIRGGYRVFRAVVSLQDR